jgi:hypothetical protein
MSAMIVFISVPILFLLNLIYLQFGTHYKIFARKQDQSRRNRIVTGAGILFTIAWLLFFLFNDFILPIFLIVLFAATLMGLIDDIWEVPLLIQMVVHLILFTIIFSDLQLLKSLTADKLIVGILLSLFFLLIVAKHDGINGLLTSSALLFFSTLVFLQPALKNIGVNNPVLYVIFALLAYGWFNFKPKAELFMGASGRIALSYLILFFMLHLLFGLPIQAVDLVAVEPTLPVFHPVYLLLVAVMSIDFLQALIRNTIARKSFTELPLLYVILREKKVSIYAIAFIYAGLQLLVNVVVVYLSGRG